MEHLLELISRNAGDHYLNDVGFKLILAAFVVFAFVFLTRFFVYKSGFKLSNIRKTRSPDGLPSEDGEEFGTFGKVWSYLLRLSIFLFVLGAAMAVFPFSRL